MTRVALKTVYKPYEVVVIPTDGPHRQYVQPTYAVAELPEGDWRMTKCGDKILFADASGNNPAMTVDKDGKWEVLNG